MSASHYFGCIDEYTHEDNQILGGVNLASALLSLMGSSFVVVHYLMFSRRLVVSQIIFWLAIADLMASFAIALSQSWLFAVSEYSWATCLTLRSFIEFSVVASFFWSSCIAFYLFYAIVWHKDMMLSEGSKGTSAGKKWNWTNVFMIVAHIVCWGTPLVFCIILLAADWYQKTESGWCHPKEPYLFIFWELPMIISFFVNIFLYGIIAFYVQRRSRKHRGTKNHLSAKIQHRLALFVLVYAVCWAPNVASHIETYIAPHCWLFWLGLIQNAFSPAQGFLNCVVYGLSNQEVWSRYRWWQHLLMIIASPFIVLPIIVLASLEEILRVAIPSLHARLFRRQYAEVGSVNYARRAYSPVGVNDSLSDLETTDT